MRRASTVALTLAALAICAGSASAKTAFVKGPYVQNVSGQSVVIMWDAGRAKPGRVIVRGPDANGQSERVIEVEADDIPEVIVDQLRPSTRYRYQVEAEGEVAHGEFATAPRGSAPFSFVVFGDSRSNAHSHRRVVERIRNEVPDFLLGTGDMVNEGASEKDWQVFFDVERDLLRNNVLYPSVGNHDRQGRGRTADNYRKYFSLPENSPDPERYYAFTYGNARFLVLDSNAYSFALTDQTAWIEQQLQAARLDKGIEHIFVSMHHPPYSVSLHGGQSELREAWTPLFERYQVDAVFSGHDHVYSRAEKNGIRYFVSGGGGAPLYPRKRRSSKLDIEANRYFERTNHYLRIHVIGALVEVTAVRADGTHAETVSWGTPPKRDPRALPVAAMEASVKAAGAGADVPRAEPVAAPPIQGPTTTPGRTRFGLLGTIGAVMTLLAGGFLFWNLRR